MFRDGIQHYLKRHRLGNTETGDLWDALEDVASVPVRSMMDGWVFTGGYPLITVRQDNPTTLHLAARQFRYQGEGPDSWTTPVLVGVHLADGTVQQIPVLVSRDPVPVEVPSEFRFLTANAGGHGFYRVAYDDKLFARLSANLGALSPIERLGVVDDVWAAVVAGKVPLRQTVAFWTHLGKEADPDVVATVSQQMDLFAHVTDDAGREALSRFIQAVVGPRLKALGWEPSPNEDIGTSRLRATLITLLGMSGNDPDVQAEARCRLYRHLDHGAQVAPEILNAAASIVVYVGGSSDVERIRQAYEGARTPQEETRYLYALAHTRTPESVEAVLGFYLSDAVKIQDSAYALGELLKNRYARGKVWEAVETHWATFLKNIPDPCYKRSIVPLAKWSRRISRIG